MNEPAPLAHPSSDDGWSIPTEFDEYRLVRPLGRGGAGMVYLAHDRLLDRPVSVKFLRRVDDAAMSRVIAEARAAARLSHPNVATLHRVGEFQGRPYLVSEYVRGQALDALPRPVPWRTVLKIGHDLARGLGAAHRRGVLHRDIKPANGIVTEAGDVKLLDFGLAKLLEPLAPRSSRGSTPYNPLPLANDSIAEEAVLGTPYYMAPEIWRGEEATPRSDLYSLGAVLYELCTGRRPADGVEPIDLSEWLQTQEPPPVCEREPSVDERLGAAIDRCLRRDPQRRFASAEELVEALDAIQSADHRPALVPAGNPYRGLQPFEPEHRALFFGRRREVDAAVERLRSAAFLLLTGDSGVGKSSLALAGVLPRIRDGALADERAWLSARFVPGHRPVAALAAAAAQALGIPEAVLAESADEEPEAFGRTVKARLGTRGLLLYIDQMEELVTVSAPREAACVAAMLAPLATGIPGVRVLASARSDFLTRLAALPGLGEHLLHALFLVRPLSQEETREAIVGPARIAGGRFESEVLVDALVSAAATAEGGLPLLQFALAELWDARDRATGTISATTLDAIGGVSGALTRHAEGVLTAMLPEQRAAARAVLLRLITPDLMRARRTARELGAQDGARLGALEALVRGRLLVARESDGETTYEIAHEALLQGWGTLARWLGDEAETRIHRERLAAAALEWERAGFDAETLWGKRQLREVQPLNLDGTSANERAFLAASRAAVRRRQWLKGAVATTFLLALAITAASAQLRANRQREAELAAQLGLAQDALTSARARKGDVEALRKSAFARFAARDRQTGELLWREAQKLDAEVERAYVAADDHFEKAALLGRNAPEVQRAFSELLFERAARAEQSGRPDLREIFLQRMRLYDVDGAFRAAWARPAKLSLRSEPPGAVVTLERYEIDSDGRMTPVADQRTWTTPTEAELPPGSWRLTFAREGHASVRQPVLIGRGEAREVSVRLPEARQVPEGFVYVPRGTFLFGSSEDESIREFFNALPAHEVETGDYLIARNETTFADWIAFLQSLPAGEQRLRMPRSSSTGLHGYLELSRVAGRWALRLQPTSRPYAARVGESIRYEARDQRQEQDWLRFPVSGISWDDAQAYVAWLDRSGKVPGARLCTEHEWERAARGADGRLYPHGNRLEPEDANFDRTYGKNPLAFGPDEVGSHPRSRSPFGLDDLVGNVWEWVSSSVAQGEAIARGGSFYFAATTCRANNREAPERTLRDLAVGLRVCATPAF